MKRKADLEKSLGGSNGSRSDRGTAEPNAAKKTRILIVEDEPAMVAGLRDNFEYEGYDVISAADGIEGLDRALADDPDLVVLDVMMPRLSGLDVCKQLEDQQTGAADHHAYRARPGSTKSSAWSSAPMTTSPNHSPFAN